MTTYTVLQGQGSPASATGSSNITICLQFSVSQAVPLTGIPWFSASGAVALPSACCIFDNATQLPVTGTLKNSPSWSGAAASGLVTCAYDGSVILQPGHVYFSAVYNGTSQLWFGSLAGVWTTGIGASGLTNGPLSAPNNASAVVGQCCVASGPVGISFPTFTESGKNYGVDVEVTLNPPSAAASSGGTAATVAAWIAANSP